MHMSDTITISIYNAHAIQFFMVGTNSSENNATYIESLRIKCFFQYKYKILV